MDELAAFRAAVERTRSLQVEERGAVYVRLFEEMVDPLVAEAREGGNLHAMYGLLEEAWRIGYEAGVFDRPPPPSTTN